MITALLALLLYSALPDIALADERTKPGPAGETWKKRQTVSPGLRPSPAPRSQPAPATGARTEIPPRKPARRRYNRKFRKMIRAYNRKGQPVGDIKLFARENSWGPWVKIQACYGDNILSQFHVTQNNGMNKLWFQFKNVTYRNRGRHRHKWISVEPGMLIRGRHIYLRAQSARGNGVISLKVRGHCIETG